MTPPPSSSQPTKTYPLATAPLFVKELIAGGAAGATAKTAVAPLERVKILFQTGRLAAGGGTGATLAAILRTEGVRGLFKGNGASVLRIVPYAAIHFGAYEQYRAALAPHVKLDAAGRVPAVVDLVAGAAAGATAVIATYPLDLARTRLAVAMETQAGPALAVGSTAATAAAAAPQTWVRPTVRSTLAATLAADGVAGLYRGVGPTLAGILPYAGLKFYVYQAAKHLTQPPAATVEVLDGGGEKGGPPPLPPPVKTPLLLTLAYGAGAGLIAQTATYPLDVVRRQMQVQGGGGAAGTPAAVAAAGAPFKSTLDGLRRVWRAGGARALFAGVSINYMKVVPSTAIGFTVYDAAKAWLGLAHNL